MSPVSHQLQTRGIRSIQDTVHLKVLKSNTAVLLNRLLEESSSQSSNQSSSQSDTLWQVRSGSLALFSIPVEQGIPKGRRRCLFTVKAGELLIPSHGLANAEKVNSITDYQILVVAAEETILQPLSIAEFCDWMIAEPLVAIAKLENWVYHLGLTLAGILPQTASTQISSCGVLDRGEVFQPGQGRMTWTQILQGQVHLVGFAGLTVTAQQGRLPLNTHLWLQAQTVVEVDIQPPVEIQKPQTFIQGVQTLQALVLQALQTLDQQAEQQERQRLGLQQQADRQIQVAMLQQMQSVFQPAQRSQLRDRWQLPSTPAQTEADALVMAAGAVGRVLGVTIVPPAASEDLRRVPDLLDAIARASHIRIRRVVLRDDWWKKDCGALLAYRAEDDRPVALIPQSEHRYAFFDPMTQQWDTCDRAIAQQLSPTAYTFYRPFPAVITPMALLKFAVLGHRKELITLILTGVAATLVGMLMPYATGLLIDQVIPDRNRDLLWQMGYGLLATALGAALFQLTQGFAILRLESYADASTQSAVWDRLLKLPVSFFRQYSVGDLSARVSTITQIRQKLSTTMLKSLFSSLFSLLNLGLLFSYSASLALIALVVALINIAVTVTAGVLTLKKTRPLLNEQGKLFGIMLQIVNGVAKFRLAGAENRAFAHWGQQYSHQLKLMMATQGIEDNLTVINKFLATLTPAVLFAFATMALQQSQGHGSEFTTGKFLAFNTAFGTFITGATSLSTIVIDILETIPIWERTQPILQGVPEVDTDKSDPGRLTGALAVEHAMFRYRADGNLILNDVSIQAEPGEFIALVGPSGSGKSTLLRLLLGFDVPESGTVYYDGQDLAGLNVAAVRRQMGVVLQNSRLMSASIFENIASGALITMDEAWEAARMAGFDGDVAAMPMGMHTVVSEGGSNLSGGQRQRLMIARALALRPRILFFDEATSALDNKTQAIVSESLDRLKVTRVVVAHRLSTIRNADRIYVLQAGQVVEQGSFEQLAQQGGVFSQLIQRQRL
ncbi:NHLP bacteriocin export ABC transporter permease/ATPase subunit [Alkalinema sp. FACHB-956]|uniref:NHLP bacteriocin export ABC transporter permease/ATPase subunit n=1 Tax=Alkalinema sp. FACHB-956 TaxID=2692768 RepID=UPI0016823D57|nr:NHLP bacteriocin export ABC transporter permease/ATPase subunit [Alkalinema sp. FACHB-956]MBD2329095.1 NHLP bacteriocin export ABC transporter permease/ATPase subunit [Alkalinema sp. FACHB-956]